MAKHILLVRTFPTGAENVLTWGTQGSKSYVKLIEEAGGKVLDQWVVTGSYDLVLLVDFRDDVASLAVSLRSAAGGLYVDTLRAFSAADVDAAGARIADVVAIRRELEEAAGDGARSARRGQRAASRSAAARTRG